jgi:4'-phosphopantetheinyl transferase
MPYPLPDVVLPTRRRRPFPLGQAELQSAFFSLWTRREAVVKCLGAGLSHSVDSFSLAPVPSGSRERVPVGTADGGAVLWVLSLPPPREGYVAAMATEGEPANVRSFIWGGSR